MEEVFRGTWVIAYRELLRFVKERSRIISSLAMPVLFLIIFGAGFNRIIGNLAPGVDFIRFMYPGIITMTIFMNSIFSGLSVVRDREFGFLREVLVAPLSRTGVVLGKASGTAVVAIAQGLIMLALAPFLGISLSPLVIVQLVPLLMLISLSLSGLGMLVAARLRSQQSFHMLTQLIIFPLIFLSGIFFPVDSVPLVLQVISKVNPLTYGVDAIRQLFLNGNRAAEGVLLGDGESVLGVTVFGHTMTVLEDVIIMAVLGFVLMSLAVWAFNKQD